MPRKASVFYIKAWGVDVDQRMIEFLTKTDELETLIQQTKYSLLLNTTTEILAGAAASGTVTLQFPASAIVSIEAFVTATGTPVKLLAETTDYTHVENSTTVTCVTDQSANSLRITYRRYSI